MTELENAVHAALSDPSPAALDAVGTAWLRQTAGAMVEAAAIRQRREEVIAEARAHCDALRRSEREAHEALRAAVVQHEEALERRRRGWSAPGPPTAERILAAGEMDAAEAKLSAARRVAAAAHAKAVAVLQRAERELSALEAG